jgi:hypothetical protein
MATTQEDRRKAAQARHNPSQTKPATPATTVPAPAPKVSGDQKPVPAQPSGDQKDTKPKVKKKTSAQVVRWIDAKKNKRHITGTIRLTDKGKADKPKRGKSLERFKLYRDGMAVAEYIEESHKAGNSKALAQADVQWDAEKGLITVS